MAGIRNMYEQSVLSAAIQNMKRTAKAFFVLFASVCSYEGHTFARKHGLCQCWLSPKRCFLMKGKNILKPKRNAHLTVAIVSCASHTSS